MNQQLTVLTDAAGSATVEVPRYFAAALRDLPSAQARLDTLNSQGGYSVPHRLITAPNEATREGLLRKIL